MNKIDIEVITLIEKVRKRLFAVKVLDSILVAISAALAAGILLAFFSKFIPIYNVYVKAAYIIIAAFGAGIIYAFLKAPSRKKAALLSDCNGLNERTVTALELIGNDSVMANLQKHDALLHLQKLDLKRVVPIKASRRYIAIALVLAAVFAVTAFMPNPMKEKAEYIHRQKVKISEAQRKADKVAEKISKNPKLTAKQKKDIEKKLQELKRDLKTAENDKELNKTIQKWDKKLELIKKDYANEDLDKIAETLSKSEMTKELAELINNRDTASIKKDLNKLAKELQTMTPSKLKALAEEYSKLAEELKNNPELKKAFLDLSNKIASGELGNLQAELDSVAKGLQDLDYDLELQDALHQLSKELKDMQSEGQGGNENKSAENGQQGNESSSRQGQSGGGSGSGTDKGQENQNPINTSGGIGQKSTSSGKTGEYEKIFTPKTIGGDGDISNISGKKGDGGNSDMVVTDKSPAVKGQDVPYDQVVGEYKQNAMESINGSDIPQGMKELVKSYFGTLEE